MVFGFCVCVSFGFCAYFGDLVCYLRVLVGVILLGLLLLVCMVLRLTELVLLIFVDLRFALVMLFSLCFLFWFAWLLCFGFWVLACGFGCGCVALLFLWFVMLVLDFVLLVNGGLCLLFRLCLLVFSVLLCLNNVDTAFCFCWFTCFVL